MKRVYFYQILTQKNTRSINKYCKCGCLFFFF